MLRLHILQQPFTAKPKAVTWIMGSVHTPNTLTLFHSLSYTSHRRSHSQHDFRLPRIAKFVFEQHVYRHGGVQANSSLLVP